MHPHLIFCSFIFLLVISLFNANKSRSPNRRTRLTQVFAQEGCTHLAVLPASSVFCRDLNSWHMSYTLFVSRLFWIYFNYGTLCQTIYRPDLFLLWIIFLWIIVLCRCIALFLCYQSYDMVFECTSSIEQIGADFILHKRKNLLKNYLDHLENAQSHPGIKVPTQLCIDCPFLSW